MSIRIEKDSLGEIGVPAEHYWGAQTQRSLEHFRIGREKMPLPVVYALAEIKKAAAAANLGRGKLSAEKAGLIRAVCDEILAGDLDAEFPLAVWQTGSGTHTNMNVNEVIANRGNALGGKKILHPNDDVNMGQSSNDVFPSACHMAAAEIIQDELLPAAARLAEVFGGLSERYARLVKIGRTHLQDATPLTLGQEISAWQYMLEVNQKQLQLALPGLHQLAIGGTAVGTGVNTFKDFGPEVAAAVSKPGHVYQSSENLFHALTARDHLVFAHGAMDALAANLMKIANDIRFLGMGPRAGLAELILPANEPGSSIMPGKVNPTQCEQLTMVAARVMGNHQTVTIAASQGNFQLNVYAPVLIDTFLQSAGLLADGIKAFTEYCAEGLKANETEIKAHVEKSLMLVTALSPVIGYMEAARIAKLAYTENLTLRESCLRETKLTAAELDSLLDPAKMVEAAR